MDVIGNSAYPFRTMPIRTPRLNAERPWKLLTFKAGSKANTIGYARVSTREQHLDLQLARLQAAGCCKVYAEKVTGSGKRPGWAACIEALRPGDVLVVLRVDRMGRRLSELVRSMDEIRDLGAHVHALEEGIDTSAKGGRFAFNLIAAMAEKVRDDIRENTRAGLDELRKRGIKVGRPTKLEPAKIAQLAHLRAQGFSLRAIGRATGLGCATVSKGLELAAHIRGDPRQLKLGGV